MAVWALFFSLLSSLYVLQMITCGSCSKGFHTFCVGEKRIPFALSPREQQDRHSSYVAEHFGTGWHCPKCQTQASQSSPTRDNDSYEPPERGFQDPVEDQRMDGNVGKIVPVTPPRCRMMSEDSLIDISPSKGDSDQVSSPLTIRVMDTPACGVNDKKGDSTEAGDVTELARDVSDEGDVEPAEEALETAVDNVSASGHRGETGAPRGCERLGVVEEGDDIEEEAEAETDIQEVAAEGLKEAHSQLPQSVLPSETPEVTHGAPHGLVEGTVEKDEREPEGGEAAVAEALGGVAVVTEEREANEDEAGDTSGGHECNKAVLLQEESQDDGVPREVDEEEDGEETEGTAQHGAEESTEREVAREPEKTVTRINTDMKATDDAGTADNAGIADDATLPETEEVYQSTLTVVTNCVEESDGRPLSEVEGEQGPTAVVSVETTGLRSDFDPLTALEGASPREGEASVSATGLASMSASLSVPESQVDSVQYAASSNVGEGSDAGDVAILTTPVAHEHSALVVDEESCSTQEESLVVPEVASGSDAVESQQSAAEDVIVAGGDVLSQNAEDHLQEKVGQEPKAGDDGVEIMAKIEDTEAAEEIGIKEIFPAEPAVVVAHPCGPTSITPSVVEISESTLNVNNTEQLNEDVEEMETHQEADASVPSRADSSVVPQSAEPNEPVGDKQDTSEDGFVVKPEQSEGDSATAATSQTMPEAEEQIDDAADAEDGEPSSGSNMQPQDETDTVRMEEVPEPGQHAQVEESVSTLAPEAREFEVAEAQSSYTGASVSEETANDVEEAVSTAVAPSPLASSMLPSPADRAETSHEGPNDDGEVGRKPATAVTPPKCMGSLAPVTVQEKRVEIGGMMLREFPSLTPVVPAPSTPKRGNRGTVGLGQSEAGTPERGTPRTPCVVSPSSLPPPTPSSQAPSPVPVGRSERSTVDSGRGPAGSRQSDAAASSGGSQLPLALVPPEEKSPYGERGTLFRDFPRSPAMDVTVIRRVQSSLPRSPRTSGPSSDKRSVSPKSKSMPKSPRRPPLGPSGSREIVETSKGPMYMSPIRSPPRRKSVAGTGQQVPDLGSHLPKVRSPSKPRSPSRMRTSITAVTVSASKPSPSSASKASRREGRTAANDRPRPPLRRSASSMLMSGYKNSDSDSDRVSATPIAKKIERSRTGGLIGGSITTNEEECSPESASKRSGRSQLRRVESLNDLNDDATSHPSAGPRGGSSMEQGNEDSLGDDLAAVVSHLKKVRLL